MAISGLTQTTTIPFTPAHTLIQGLVSNVEVLTFYFIKNQGFVKPRR